MKNLSLFLLATCLLSSCGQKDQPIVSSTFIDSLLRHYTVPTLVKDNETEMQFWSSRINPALPGYINESRYAGGLAMQFRLLGDIDSLKKSDSILQKVNSNFNYKEASTNLALAAHCITGHRFMQADSFLQKAKQLGIRPYESQTASFDLDFELGKYNAAAIELNSFRSDNDYGYFFRKSKMDHLNGSLDSAVRDMQRAAELAGANTWLKEVALSNAADLYIHAGDWHKANDLYTACVRMNSADFHSLMGLGWIAFAHDHKDTLAEKIFRFVQSKTGLPDPLFKLAEMDRKASALAFESKATDTRYGKMYSKYLIQLYTGILNKPALAESMAKEELNNRATPQTYAWYAWALFANGKNEEAYKVFTQYVSGQPLESLELYYMGKLMKGINKGYNANEFFKAAYKTRYDLSPAMSDDIRQQLED